MELELSEGRIGGAKYYVVRPWPGPTIHIHGINTSPGITWRELEHWAIETFGPAIGSIWSASPDLICGRWYMNNSKFWFRNEADRTFFILRWQ